MESTLAPKNATAVGCSPWEDYIENREGSSSIGLVLFVNCIATILANAVLFAVIFSKKESRNQVHVQNVYLQSLSSSSVPQYHYFIFAEDELICPIRVWWPHFLRWVIKNVLTITERVSLSKDAQRKCAPAFRQTRNKHFQIKALHSTQEQNSKRNALKNLVTVYISFSVYDLHHRDHVFENKVSLSENDNVDHLLQKAQLFNVLTVYNVIQNKETRLVPSQLFPQKTRIKHF